MALPRQNKIWEGRINGGKRHSTARKAWFAVFLALAVWAVLLLVASSLFAG